MARKNKKKAEIKSLKELVSYVDLVLPPIVLGPEVNDLCSKVDEFYKNYPKQHRKQKPADLIKGAFYAARPECRSNLDWMSQAVNSLRDVLYPLFSNEISKNNLIKIFKKYATNNNNRSITQNIEFVRTFNNLDKIYKQLSDLTHHGTELKGFSEKEYANFSENDFENLLVDFVSVLKKAFSLQQIYIHTIIDLIVQKRRKTNALKQDLQLVLSINPDARHYFFAEADERWINWLWVNGFLEAIKQKAGEPTRYGYKMPEVNYLVRMNEKVPAKVVDIMLAVPISADTFNPEVIYRFLQICSTLPANQLARMVNKIRDDQWIPLMEAFNQWGFEYEKMFEILAQAKDYESLIILADAVLSVRTKEEIGNVPRHRFTDNPFYFDNLSYTKVFEHLVKVDDEYTEQAFALAMRVMSKVIALWKKEDEDKGEKVFKVDDIFMLLSVDFFTLKPGQKDHLSPRDNIRKLFAVITVLARRLIGEKYSKNNNEARRIFKQYIGNFDDDTPPLPDTRLVWRLRLFVMSLCPEIFKEELKKSFFRLFSVEGYYNELISGTEYLKALRVGLSVLSDTDKRDYVKQVVEYFVKREQEKEKENWHIQEGSKILSIIADHLTKEEKKEAEKAGFKIDKNYKPSPSITEIRGGFVKPQGPITADEFNKLPINEIAQKLRDEWSPEKLREKYTDDDFLRPHNAEGVGDLLRNDIPKRLQDYINNANLLFERDALDPHYTYSFLRGVQEAIKNNRELASKIKWDGIINMFLAIKEAGEKEAFDRVNRERDSFNVWLAGWDALYSAMPDVLQELLTEKDGSVLIDFDKYRREIFSILKYLLSYPDPETAKSKTKSPGEEDYMVSDPFTIAINSVRGSAFEAFVLFIYLDGKQFKKEDKVKIAADVKKLYENVLKNENTRALMFMFGHFLPSFYFRDREWIRGLLPQIFPQEPEKHRLYTAAWEGYLVNNLYEDIFFDPDIQKLYERGLRLRDTDYPKKQEHFREPEEGLAVHLALAYMHYKKFGFGHTLFEEFWKRQAPEQHARFVSFLGRSFVSGDNSNANELLEKDPESKKRLMDFWDWMLNNYNEPRPFIEFGFWINLEKDIFEPSWLAERVKKTLEKTKGVLDWHYGLLKSLVHFAKEAPAETLEIVRYFLLEGWIRGNARRRPPYLHNEWIETLKILYQNPQTKSDAYILIDELIREGGSTFWNLKEIVNK